MERIKLTKEEKVVLRMVAGHTGGCLPTYPEHIFNACVRSLERKGLVKGAYVEGGRVEAAKLTNEGRQYLCCNPSLSNPINWNFVFAVAAIIISIIALFVSCYHSSI